MGKQGGFGVLGMSIENLDVAPAMLLALCNFVFCVVALWVPDDCTSALGYNTPTRARPDCMRKTGRLPIRRDWWVRVGRPYVGRRPVHHEGCVRAAVVRTPLNGYAR
jgi:hypothetical protein